MTPAQKAKLKRAAEKAKTSKNKIKKMPAMQARPGQKPVSKNKKKNMPAMQARPGKKPAKGKKKLKKMKGY